MLCGKEKREQNNRKKMATCMDDISMYPNSFLLVMI